MVLDGVGRYGWQCPVCKRIYAPFMEECRYCNVKEERVDVLSIIEKPNTLTINNWVKKNIKTQDMPMMYDEIH